MGFIIGIIVWFIVAYILRFSVGLEEWGPWIGMIVGASVWGYVDKFTGSDEAKIQPSLTNSSDTVDATIQPLEVAHELSHEVLKVVKSNQQPQLARLLAYTYDVWKRGTLDFFSEDCKKEASSVSAEEFIESTKPIVNLLRASNSAREFQNGEYMVARNPESFLMTNQAIYFFSDNALLSKPKIVELPTIQSYRTKSHWASVSIEIEQSDGNKISLPKVISGPHESIVAHFSQTKNN